MDESASDLSQGVIALSNVAEEAGVNKFTGKCEAGTRVRGARARPAQVFFRRGHVSSQQKLHCTTQVAEFLLSF